jgi:8-oxo-dGTP diphosphatase
MPHMPRIPKMLEQTFRVHSVLQLSLMLVVAAVIERNQKILIGQRKRNGNHPLKWEFPGGKVEPGEAPKDALERELKEELAIKATIGPELDRYDVQYGEGPLTHLIFYQVTSFEGEPQNLNFEQIQWESKSSLTNYDFLSGDEPFLKKLA